MTTSDAVALLVPLAYSPELEQLEEDEAQTTAQLFETMRGISQTVHAHSGHAERGVHAKSHGIVRGTIDIPASLPDVLRQGLFAQPGCFPVVIRFSTSPGDILDDKVSTPRAVAMKIVGIEGARLPGTENDVTQDLLMVDGPAFLAPSLKAFLRNLKPLAATTDRAPEAKKALSAVLRGVEKVMEAVGGESATLISMGGHALTHLLGQTFFTQAPIRFGRYVAKLSLAPVSPSLVALKDVALDTSQGPDAIRAAIVSFFESQDDAEWELRAQLAIDPGITPIEDASVPWPEDQTPYRMIAKVRVGSQNAWSEPRLRAVDERMSFSPWHGLEAHRPLGSIMRARRSVYEAIAAFRASRNGTVLTEPHSLDDLPD